MNKTGLWMKRHERRNLNVVLLLVLGTALGNQAYGGECRSCQSHFSACNGGNLPGSSCRYCEKGFELWSGYCYETVGGYKRLSGCGSTCESCGNANCFESTQPVVPIQAVPAEASHAEVPKSQPVKDDATAEPTDAAEKEEAPEPADIDVSKTEADAPSVEPTTEAELPLNQVVPVDESREDVPVPDSELFEEAEAELPANDVPLPKNDVETDDVPTEEKVPANPLDILPENDVPATPPNSVKRLRRIRTISRRPSSKDSTTRLLRHLKHVSASR